MRQINEIIVHCSASNVISYDFDAIRKDHKSRGWSDIGYHFGIDWDGDVHFLRPVQRIGAHVKGRNRHSIGICILGLDGFRDHQLKQAAKLCESLCNLLSLSQKAIRGHYEFNPNKTCPNFDIEHFKKKYIRGC